MGVESRNATPLTWSYIGPPPHVHFTQVTTGECAASVGADLGAASRSASDSRHQRSAGRGVLRGCALRPSLRLDGPEYLAGLAPDRDRPRGAHRAGTTLLAQH